MLNLLARAVQTLAFSALLAAATPQEADAWVGDAAPSPVFTENSVFGSSQCSVSTVAAASTKPHQHFCE